MLLALLQQKTALNVWFAAPVEICWLIAIQKMIEWEAGAGPLILSSELTGRRLRVQQLERSKPTVLLFILMIETCWISVFTVALYFDQAWVYSTQ